MLVLRSSDLRARSEVAPAPREHRTLGCVRFPKFLVLGARSRAHPLRAAPSISLGPTCVEIDRVSRNLISTQGPTKRVAVPKSVRAVQHVRQDVEAAVWMHAEPFDVYVRQPRGLPKGPERPPQRVSWIEPMFVVRHEQKGVRVR